MEELEEKVRILTEQVKTTNPAGQAAIDHQNTYDHPNIDDIKRRIRIPRFYQKNLAPISLSQN